MSDLVVFAGIVGLVAVVGAVIGMIVADRIDRLLVVRPPAGTGDGAPAEGGHVEEQP